MLKILDEILLSEEVVNNFYKQYNNVEFKKWLLDILPEIENCKNTKQDNPWHIYNCLEHILHSVEEMNKQTKNFDRNIRRMLSYTMFLHDIGKPECYIRRYSKLYKREVDSYFNHNLASVKIANRVLGIFGFNNQEIEIIKMLIEDHDIFMFIKLQEDGNRYHKVLNEECLKEEIERLNKVFDGKTLMKYLIMVGRSDNLTQNLRMSKESLHMLDVMNDMLLKLR